MGTAQGYQNSLVRQMNEQAVIETVLRYGPVSRVEIAERTGLSKPTVSDVMRTLAAGRLVRETGKSAGSVGRSAVLYEVNRHVGHVIGIDLGGNKLCAAIVDLFGEILAEELHPTDERGGEFVLQQIIDVSKHLTESRNIDWAAVTSIALASPGVFNPKSDHVTLAFNICGFDDVSLTQGLTDALKVKISVQNDVNAAAIGERWRGIGRSVDHFAFLGIGTGIGMGLVLNGELHTGFRGAAGEVAYLPIRWDGFDPDRSRRGALEEAASGSGIRAMLQRRVQHDSRTVLKWNAAVREVFDAAADGDEVATAILQEEASLVAQAILAVCSVVDPELVILGGGIGANPVLLPYVRKEVNRVAPYAIRVETSVLGDRASLIGALAIGLRTSRETLFSSNGNPGARP